MKRSGLGQSLHSLYVGSETLLQVLKSTTLITSLPFFSSVLHRFMRCMGSSTSKIKRQLRKDRDGGGAKTNILSVGYKETEFAPNANFWPFFTPIVCIQLERQTWDLIMLLSMILMSSLLAACVSSNVSDLRIVLCSARFVPQKLFLIYLNGLCAHCI